MSQSPAASLRGLRVLIVEDQMVVAMDIEDALSGLGCAVVGPVGQLDAAVSAAGEEELDAAILDIDINGQPSFPVADKLKARGIPFMFSTGYGGTSLPEQWRGQPRLGKPFRRAELEELLRIILTA